MIKKIKSIKNMAVFENFDWDKTVKDNDKSVMKFSHINIFYGRNYSGKTTISRIFRALETGVLSDKYLNPEFIVEMEDSTIVTRNDLKNHQQLIRVFNEDFVRENLRFIANPDENITAFAIVSSENNTLELDIEKEEKNLGSDSNGLLRDLKEQQNKLDTAKSNLCKFQSNFDKKLNNKANSQDIGIRHNKLYGNANYNVTKLKEDIKYIIDASYQSIAEEDVDKLRSLLRAEPNDTILEFPLLNLKFDHFVKETKKLIENKITVSNQISELVNDALLGNWVDSGRKHHATRETCGFCGSILPTDLLDRLNKHFNEESETLKSEIKKLIENIKTYINEVDLLIVFNESIFYPNFLDNIAILKNEFSVHSTNYVRNLQHLISLLEKRYNDIFTAIDFNDIEDISIELEKIHSDYNNLRVKSNNQTVSLSKDQEEAKNTLRLHDVK